MSDAPAPPPRNGNGRGGTLVAISEKLIRVLPPAFLLLIIINVLFLGVMMWVFNHNAEARTELLTKIVEKCLLVVPPR
jgi:hypothetical protein